MKLTLESTEQFVDFDGVPTRVWVGKTAAGVAVQAFITGIAVEASQDASEFARELLEHAAPVCDWPRALAREAMPDGVEGLLRFPDRGRGFMTACNHDEGPATETMREHMIRAHGCTEAMVRWVLYNRGFGIGVRVALGSPKTRSLALMLGQAEFLRFARLSFVDETQAEGFIQGYRFGVGSEWP